MLVFLSTVVTFRQVAGGGGGGGGGRGSLAGGDGASLGTGDAEVAPVEGAEAAREALCSAALALALAFFAGPLRC